MGKGCWFREVQRVPFSPFLQLACLLLVWYGGEFCRESEELEHKSLENSEKDSPAGLIHDSFIMGPDSIGLIPTRSGNCGSCLQHDDTEGEVFTLWWTCSPKQSPGAQELMSRVLLVFLDQVFCALFALFLDTALGVRLLICIEQMWSCCHMENWSVLFVVTHVISKVTW